ncbi:hypothetical protein SPHV1_690007 [Novosphingobium sp. KN65.2]|nr:hypothetical protein SPHV1_690007 [Novosphingobium sp. KN65.2]
MVPRAPDRGSGYEIVQVQSKRAARLDRPSVGIILPSDEGHGKRQGTDSECRGKADCPFNDGHLFLLLHSIRDGFAPFPSHMQHLVLVALILNLYLRNRDCKFCNLGCTLGRMRSFPRATAIWTLAAPRIRGQP